MTFQDGIVNASSLKRRVGEFDLETIHTLDLANEGIVSLGCLVDCTSLERLNLSDNEITDLSAIGALPSLRVLNLSCNRLTSLDGLQSCSSLQSLNLSGNLISCADDLNPLCACSNLTELRLTDNLKGWSNPVCLQSDYFDDVITMLSSLRMLDGERVRGQGSELYRLCRNIDRAVLDSEKESACINGPVREKTLPRKWMINPDKNDNQELWEKRAMLHTTYQALQRDVEKLQSDAEAAIEDAQRYLAANK